MSARSGVAPWTAATRAAASGRVSPERSAPAALTPAAIRGSWARAGAARARARAKVSSRGRRMAGKPSHPQGRSGPAQAKLLSREGEQELEQAAGRLELRAG